MITPGTKWQVRALADAADDLDEFYRVGVHAIPETQAERSTAYCRGVADILRLIVGDLVDDQSKWPDELVAVYTRYLHSM